MREVAVRAAELSKQYQIGRQLERLRVYRDYRTLRDAMMEALRNPFLRVSRWLSNRDLESQDNHTFWALKDVSFEVNPGEVVAIIGRNGAGKSTLLKILSRVTAPTRGFAEIRGRVGSLLEVGTGFHPELTGRENVFLNGAILGMRKHEIARKFDEIIGFAELEQFVETPIKFYSSGMYLRLAFAVAAHLEPEILIADEVLAVGDARFQKKCLDKMHDVGRQGRTVLFVSHNMAAVTRLCDRAILLEEGRIAQDGPARRVVANYLTSSAGTSAAREWLDPAKAPGREVARLRAVRVRNDRRQVSDEIDIRSPVDIEIEFDVVRPGYVLTPTFVLGNEQGIEIFVAHDLDPVWRRRRRPAGRYVSTARIPGNFLAEGTMFVTAGLNTLDPLIVQFDEPNAAAFQVVDSLDGDTARGDYAGTMIGIVRPVLEWSTRFTPIEQAVVEPE